jgi:hypothetical protein
MVNRLDPDGGTTPADVIRRTDLAGLDDEFADGSWP